MRWLGFVILSLPLSFLLGCTPGPNPIRSKSSIGSMGVEMWASDNCVRPKETVELGATVSNHGDSTKVIELKDKPVLDIILDYAGKTPKGVRRWSDGKPLTRDMTRLELAPGASKSIELNWLVDEGTVGPVGINAQFIYGERFGGVAPTILVNVGECPGPLGP